MVVLRPGLPGNHLTGTAPVNGIYVKFQGGIADVKDDKFIEMMKNHPAFGQDFIMIDEQMEDPFAYQRKEVEPAHTIQEIKYGYSEKAIGSAKNTKLNPEIQKMLQEEAAKMAKAMLPGMMKSFLEEMKKESEKEGTNDIIEDKTEEKPSNKKTQPKNEKKVETPTT